MLKAGKAGSPFGLCVAFLFSAAPGLAAAQNTSIAEVVVVHYSTKMTYEHPDGWVTSEHQLYKFTHSWMKTGSQWQIIGGMCAPFGSPQA